MKRGILDDERQVVDEKPGAQRIAVRQDRKQDEQKSGNRSGDSRRRSAAWLQNNDDFVFALRGIPCWPALCLRC
jgi:hypothetical protein